MPIELRNNKREIYLIFYLAPFLKLFFYGWQIFTVRLFFKAIFLNIKTYNISSYIVQVCLNDVCVIYKPNLRVSPNNNKLNFVLF